MTVPSALTLYVQKYMHERKGFVIPDARDAILWSQTEVAEAIELLMARKQWLRNHPVDKEQWSPERFAEELGDAILMLIIAGIVEDVDPTWAMMSKIADKLNEQKPRDEDVPQAH